MHVMTVKKVTIGEANKAYQCRHLMTVKMAAIGKHINIGNVSKKLL